MECFFYTIRHYYNDTRGFPSISGLVTEQINLFRGTRNLLCHCSSDTSHSIRVPIDIPLIGIVKNVEG